jgi:hypothetical protein
VDRSDAARRILRSLCAATPEEQSEAANNYRSTLLEQLGLDGIEKSLLDMITEFYRRGGPPSLLALQERAEEKVDTPLKHYIREVNAETQSWGVNYHDLVLRHTELRGTEVLSSNLLEVSQVLRDGKKIQEGREQKTLKGVNDAIEFGISKLAVLRRDLNPLQRPMTQEEAVDNLRQEYVERMTNPTLSYGLATGLSPIDEKTRGAQNKELWIVAGFVAHGKTTFLINWARYLAYEGGFSILYYSLEMDKQLIWRIMAGGHSCHPKFNRPLKYVDLKSATLDSDDADHYLNVVLPDLQQMPGRIEIHNPSGRRTTMDDIWSAAEITNRERPLDLVIIDYVGIVAAPKHMRNASKAERINENILEAKRMTTEFNHGAGITVVSAHQINRKGVEEAKKAGGIYEISAIADANEAERCLPKWQRIPTNQGYLKVRDLTKNLGVASSSEMKLVTDTYDSGYQDMLLVRTDRGRNIVISKNTRVRVWDGSKLLWSRAGDLNVGQTLVSGLGYNLFAEHPPLLQKTLRYPHEASIKQPDVLTEDLAELFGYMAGDGYTSKGEVVGFLINKDELDLAPRLTSFFEDSFGLKLQKPELRNNAYHYRVSSNFLNRWFNLNGLGGNCYTKTIPSFLFKSPRAMVIRWLIGLWNAEGHLGKHIELGMTNHNIVNWVQEFLLNLGIDSTIGINVKGGTHTQRPESISNPKLRVRGKESNTIFGELNLFTQKDKASMLSSIILREDNKTESFIMTTPYMREIIRSQPADNLSRAFLGSVLYNRVLHWRKDLRDILRLKPLLCYWRKVSLTLLWRSLPLESGNSLRL